MVDINNQLKRKRKSAFEESIFELNDNDLSPEVSPQPGDTFEAFGPDSKLARCTMPNSLESNADSGFSQQSAVSDDILLNNQVEEGEIDECECPEGEITSGTHTSTLEMIPSGCTVSACTKATITGVEGNCTRPPTQENNLEVQILIGDPNNCTDTTRTEEKDTTDDSSGKDTQVPAIRINFRDTTIANMYEKKIVKFLKSFVEFAIKTHSDGLNIDVDINGDENHWVVVDEVINTTPRKHHKKTKNKAKKELFMLDTTPNIALSETKSMQYSTKFCIDSGQKVQVENEVKFVSNQNCFNCDANHSLRDCPHPKNFTKINIARQKFKSNQNKSVRYHLEEDQKYAHLVPGKISDKLRKALGLRSKDLPPYIYQMRVFGYPPGWIEEATIEHSTLSMFGCDGQDISGTSKKNGIDADKIIDYPGFNTPMEEGVRDDYMLYNVPPFSEQFSKQAMLNYIRNLEDKTKDNLEICDMDVDKNENDETSADSSEIAHKELHTNTKERSQSPSLNDLEKEKEELLSQLHSSDADVDAQTENEKPMSPPSPKDCSNETSSPALVKASSLGTPILKSASPYSTLPKPDNFSLNISPVINFENLPNSTGKYEQMTGVLQKVRHTLKHLQSQT